MACEIQCQRSFFPPTTCFCWVFPVMLFTMQSSRLSQYVLAGLFCLYSRSLLPLQQVSFAVFPVILRTMQSEQPFVSLCISRSLQQVSFASTVGLFCLYCRSLLPLQQVSCASVVGLFCLYSRSLLPLYQVSFDTNAHTSRTHEPHIYNIDRNAHGVDFIIFFLGRACEAESCNQRSEENMIF